jgi:hypothetical protein
LKQSLYSICGRLSSLRHTGWKERLEGGCACVYERVALCIAECAVFQSQRQLARAHTAVIEDMDDNNIVLKIDKGRQRPPSSLTPSQNSIIGRSMVGGTRATICRSGCQGCDRDKVSNTSKEKDCCWCFPGSRHQGQKPKH